MKLGRQFRQKLWPKPSEKYCYACGKVRLNARLLVTIRQIDLCDECIEGAHAIVTTRFLQREWEKLKSFAP